MQIEIGTQIIAGPTSPTSHAGRRCRSLRSRSLRQLFAGLLSHHVGGVPVWPVCVALPNALLMLAVSGLRTPKCARQVACGAEGGRAGFDAPGEPGRDLLQLPARADITTATSRICDRRRSKASNSSRSGSFASCARLSTRSATRANLAAKTPSRVAVAERRKTGVSANCTTWAALSRSYSVIGKQAYRN